MVFSRFHFSLGIFIGIGLIIGFIYYFPDGNLKIVFCDVGQGDAIYIRMPNQVDVLIDGGPNDRVLDCLGVYMPFYDRTLEIVMMTHPQKDHLRGFIEVTKRYSIREFVTSPVENSIDDYELLMNTLKEKKIPVRFVVAGDRFVFDEVSMIFLWPEKKWLTNELNLDGHELAQIKKSAYQGDIKGVSSDRDPNMFSLYAHISYGDFDALFTGDGDIPVQEILLKDHRGMIPAQIEVLKYPHHGSKTGMKREFYTIIKPQTAIVQVGKNSYGHPSKEALQMLESITRVFRTDQNGTVEVESDGVGYEVRSEK